MYLQALLVIIIVIHTLLIQDIVIQPIHIHITLLIEHHTHIAHHIIDILLTVILMVVDSAIPLTVADIMDIINKK
jgi:hypothetical protein